MAEDQNTEAPGSAGPGQQPGVGQPPASLCTDLGTGAQPAVSAHPPGSGVPAPDPALWRRFRVGMIAGLVIAVLAVLGFVLQHVAATSPKGSLTLPGTLLGLSKNTSPPAVAVDRAFLSQVVSGAQGKLLHPVVGAYGSPPGTRFVVAGGGTCGTCTPKSAALLRLYSTLLPGARLFPSGRNGGILVCAQSSLIFCWWSDDMTGGLVAYYGGSASSLTDAAAKTNQIRAAVEH